MNTFQVMNPDGVIPHRPAPSAPTMPVQSSVGGWSWRIVQFVLNVYCLTTAVEEYRYFNYSINKRVYGAYDRNRPDFDGQKSCRIAYIVIVAVLTMASAIACGADNIYRRFHSKGTKILEPLYFTISGFLLVILFISLLGRLFQENENFRDYYSSEMVKVITLAYANSVAYIAAAINAWVKFIPNA